MAWPLCITGTLFCLYGLYEFKKNVFEEGKTVRRSIIIMIMGVILISLGTARYFGLIH